jgi:carboxymethylenebutenolidase
VAGAGADRVLPGVEPTFRRAEVLAIAVVGFERARIRSQRILWDHATMGTQLGIAHGTATGRAASGLAR